MRGHLLKFVITAFALFDAIGIACSAPANTLATWTDNSGTHAWENFGNWDINQVPNNSSFDVRFSTSGALTCNLSSQFQIGSFFSINGLNLNMNPGSLLAITSSNGITNNGRILVNSNAAHVATTFRFDTSVTINGSGRIQLNGIAAGDSTFLADGVTITNGVNHTIDGRGDLSMATNNTVLVNNGTISGDSPGSFGDPLRISLSNSLGNQNNGTITAGSGGGSLLFREGFIDQRGGGRIVNNGGKVTLGDTTHSPSFRGGVFDADMTAVNVTFDGCTLSRITSMPAGGLLTILAGGLVNNSSLFAANIRFDASTAISGIGKIYLQGETILADGFTVTYDAKQPIQGFGDILVAANNAKLINNGTITGTGGSLRVFLSTSGGSQNNKTIGSSGEQGPGLLSLQQGTLDQTNGGVILAVGTAPRAFMPGASSSVQIGGAQFFTVTGGTLNTTNSLPFTGVIQGVAAILSGAMTNLGDFQVPVSGLTVVTATTLGNYRTITLNASSSLLRFDGSTLVGGPGAIILTNNATLEINNNAANNVTNGNGHTIKGNGTIQIDSGSALTNNGLIVPGLSAGVLNFSGDLQLGASSNLSFEIGGTNPAIDYDVLHKTDNGTLTLNGKLTVTLINGFTPVAPDTFTIITTQSMLAGAFNNVPNGARLNTGDGSGSFVVSYSGNNVVLSGFGPVAPTPTPTPTPTATPAPTATPNPTPTTTPNPTATPTPTPITRLANISTRLRVETGDNVLIGGFILTGTQPKKVIIRAIGPSLGLADKLPDPTLELYSGSTLLESNDNWVDSPEKQAIIDSTFAPSNDFESAVVATLPASNAAYTVVVRGVSNVTGTGLVEVYDLDQAADSKLANLSTRGFVQTGDNILIAGMIVLGPGSQKVIVRAIGPSLSLPGKLDDPTLELRDSNGTLLQLNDNWVESADKQAIIDSGVPPTNDFESAIVETLPGNGASFTAIVRGVNGSVGIALVEVYAPP